MIATRKGPVAVFSGILFLPRQGQVLPLPYYVAFSSFLRHIVPPRAGASPAPTILRGLQQFSPAYCSSRGRGKPCPYHTTWPSAVFSGILFLPGQGQALPLPYYVAFSSFLRHIVPPG